MPTPIKTYDLASVYLIIGGYRIGGFGEEGGIEFEYGADIGETKISADGQATFSRNNNDSMTATITVMETSKSYKDLAALMQAQMDAETIEALAFRMEDEINGDKVQARYATFLTRPTPNKGRSVGERVFKVFLPNAAQGAKFGANITI